MRIGQSKNIAQRARFWGSGVLVLAIFALGVWVGHQGGYAALGELWSVPVQIFSWFQGNVASDKLPYLVLDIDFSAYSTLLQQRETAVYIPSGSDFVTATVRVDANEAVPIRVRSMEGLTHSSGLGEFAPGDDKWNFEVRTRQEYLVLGMQRFYLMDPADNNWLNQWAFAQALAREGVLAARYQFVQLVINGANYGIYAVQEGFGAELPLSQGRPEGIIMRFDTTRLWESLLRYSAGQGEGALEAMYADPVANLSLRDVQYFEVDTLRDAEIADDPELAAQKNAAIGLLRALQTGEARASDVFEVTQYGRFLALVELWGATGGTALTNLHYYYHPVTARLEPIGFNANALGNDGHLSLAATYHDPVLQESYAREVWRVSDPAYLDELQSLLEPEFRRLQQVIRGEVGDVSPPWEALHQRQEAIRLSLQPVQSVFAYLGPQTTSMSGTLGVEVGNILNLPVEIVGFDIDGATNLPARREWISSGEDALVFDASERVVLRAVTPQDGTVAMHYVDFDLPLIEIHRLDAEVSFVQEVEVRVQTRILGLPMTTTTVARYGYPDIVSPPDVFIRSSMNSGE
ncbi:MAG: CotH kinase family protein [Anaerolineae bacterium]|nr:CotH kinase family protein [Anaerolineae bacterium]